MDYGYDDGGNRSYVADKDGSVLCGYSDANEIQKAGGETFTFDQAGNMQTRVKNGQTVTYAWDALDRLIEVKKPGEGKTIRYSYNGDNLRVKKEVETPGGTETTRYLYDGLSVVAEVDGSGNLVRGYNPGIGTVDGKGTQAYYLYDGEGNVAGLVDGKGGVVGKYSYDAYGKAEGVFNDSNGYRFVGGGDVYTDDDAGLEYMWNRWYDDELGRFLSRDPIGYLGGENLYGYALNNPINIVDPLGLNGQRSSWENFSGGYYFGTGIGEQSAEYWADRYEGSKTFYGKFGNGAGGLLASLWTPDSYLWSSTTLTLGLSASGWIAGIGKAKAVGISLWPAAAGGRQIVNGITYSAHALERMQPVGTILKSGKIFSRGVPVSAVENAIKYGLQTSGEGGAIIHTFENVQVITLNAGKFVLSVIKLGH